MVRAVPLCFCGREGPLLSALSRIGEDLARGPCARSSQREHRQRPRACPARHDLLVPPDGSVPGCVHVHATRAGRRVGRKCVVPSSRNARRRRCTRTIVAGVLHLKGHAGLTGFASKDCSPPITDSASAATRSRRRPLRTHDRSCCASRSCAERFTPQLAGLVTVGGGPPAPVAAPRTQADARRGAGLGLLASLTSRGAWSSPAQGSSSSGPSGVPFPVGPS